jgi:hypothetical protein
VRHRKSYKDEVNRCPPPSARRYVAGLALVALPTIDDDLSCRSWICSGGVRQQDTDGLALQRPKYSQSCRTFGLRTSGGDAARWLLILWSLAPYGRRFAPVGRGG